MLLKFHVQSVFCWTDKDQNDIFLAEIHITKFHLNLLGSLRDETGTW
jgi:hypothetical protein